MLKSTIHEEESTKGAGSRNSLRKVVVRTGTKRIKSILSKIRKARIINSNRQNKNSKKIS
jgi:hypothetical protein